MKRYWKRLRNGKKTENIKKNRFVRAFAGFLIVTISILQVSTARSQNFIPSERVLSVDELKNFLSPDVKAESVSDLAEYFRNQFAIRYFYDWNTLDERLKIYNEKYSPESGHRSRALDHMGKYNDSTQWVLPFNYLNGDPVNAYALRHLARSHKMVDIAFLYFEDNKDPKYINYFTTQMRSLNTALELNKYEKIEDGNGVYEVFRSGYRILNWLRIHNMFLGEEAYSDEDQLLSIATMLQHGQHLYERNSEFRSGNHQTRGMSALAMLGILFRDFAGADKWYELAMTRLEEHLDREINSDGFQFERSVHYHISDIGNFFYVYQLAKINEVMVGEAWEAKLESLFTTLTQIAYPDKSAPVLQDDTNRPWSEKNEIGEVMALGYLLFDKPEYGYFAASSVTPNMYWFISAEQLESLKDIKEKKPRHKSLSFEETGYYIMRQGWNKKNHMMIITAGLDDKKPDHQHGDMLGVQAYANGRVLLPNYQVRYSLPDYEFFKNSLVKNVALVDDLMQGRKYRGNRGGSGFGKFGYLPNPTTILWNPAKGREWYIGSHDGFEEVGVSYSRQVFSVENDFWIVKDNFNSENKHDFKQVWQGHYSIDAYPDLIRSTFDDGSGLDIYQMSHPDNITQDGTRGKGWTIITKEGETHFSFITILYPFSYYSQSLNPASKDMKIRGWVLDNPGFDVSGENLRSISKNGRHYLFNVEKIKIKDQHFSFTKPVDLYFSEEAGEAHLLEDDAETVTALDKKKFNINKEIKKNSFEMKTGDVLSIITK